MSKQDARLLFEKYQSGQCNPEEQAIVENWLTFGEAKGLDLSEEELDADLRELRRRVLPAPNKVRRLWPRVAVVAAAVAAVVVGVWVYSSIKYQDVSIKTGRVESVEDVAPGKSGATLTLANGAVIALSGEKKGVIVGEKLKYSDGSTDPSLSRSDILLRRAREGLGSPSRGERGVVVIAQTAKGQTYEFVLPDGTKVWLNADSKIEFAPNFIDGKTRNVKLTGETYFAVKHNAKQPFRVESQGQIVEDIGTEFNINAYMDEKHTRTTLVEGSARVLSAPHAEKFSHAPKDMSYGREDGVEDNVFLMPNQQATLKGIKLDVRKIDVTEVVAWKEGLFAYNNTTLEEVMRQAARWYDVTLVYEDEALKQKKLSGTVTRYDNLSSLLKAISYTTNVNFKIEGQKLLIKK